MLPNIILMKIHYLDIVDCNAGDHGQAFATNFNPEINIREITQDGKILGKRRVESNSCYVYPQTTEYPNIGPKESYLQKLPKELESLVKFSKQKRAARFWMTFGQYI